MIAATRSVRSSTNKRHQRVARVLRSVLDVDGPPGGDLPDRLRVVRVERRRLSEQACVPLLGRGVVGHRDAGEQGREVHPVLLYGVGQPVQRGHQVVGQCGPGAPEPALVGELRPVVGMGHQRAVVVARLELPPPQVSWRIGVDLGGPPGNPPAFVELDDMVLPHLSPGQRHGEHVPDCPHALAGLGRRQVLVAVPRRLPGRVGDQLEEHLRRGVDHPAGTDDAPLLAHTRPYPAGRLR